jgi:hypothetical protein
MRKYDAVNALPPVSLTSSTDRQLAGWRKDAARLAAQLLCEVSPAAADEVLDLRSRLLDGNVSAASVLQAFFAARNQLETEHYLLFYRLRRVCEPALALEVSTGPEGETVRAEVDFRCRDFGQLRRHVQRERFEHDLTVQAPGQVKVEVVWRF